jgi:hypothetical protein
MVAESLDNESRSALLNPEIPVILIILLKSNAVSEPRCGVPLVFVKKYPY